MEAFSSKLNSKIRAIELNEQHTADLLKELEGRYDKFIERARDALKKKSAVNPKPQKRIMRIINAKDILEEENDETDEEQQQAALRKAVVEVVPEQQPERGSLRPVRSAKVNASKNLKEVPTKAKLRNDNNVAVLIKNERSSSVRASSDSAKENTRPNNQDVDEGVGSMPDLRTKERSMSVEIIPSKPVEIDITEEKDTDKMPPPPIPVKGKKKAPKQQSVEIPADPTQPIPVRFTRSKIKKEKPSIGKTKSLKDVGSSKSSEDEAQTVKKTASETIISTKSNDSVASKKGTKKNYPMPILVKIERDSGAASTSSELNDNAANAENIPPSTGSNDISPKTSVEVPQTAPVMNETVTLTSNLPANQTVTLTSNFVMNETYNKNPSETYNKNPNETYNKGPNDSLMTEDNDDDVSMETPLVQLADHKQKGAMPQALPLKFKKNEVFNPYLSSPVKQKVQAFEKHAAATPDKSKPSTSKYNTLKAGTPSKIALYSSKTTPLNNAKQKYMNAITSSASSTATSSNSKKTLTKKYTSLSHDSNEDLRKNAQLMTQQLEEKKRQREEKQRQVQLQREAIEKQKREQTLQAQRERDEKFRKIMQEKEEAKRLEAQKKKALKENQEKKYAEERARKEECAAALKEPQSASKDDSLYVKMQKQIIVEKAKSQSKKVDKNAYSFDMLNTEDETDDESCPSKKRPDPPQWSKKPYRKSQIFVQSYINSNLLDALFSSQPINVDLKEIFPKIDARKLVRNSSAVWNTPPRYSQIPKY